MKNIIYKIILFTISILLAGCGAKTLEDAVEDGAQKLDSLAIRELLAGSTVDAEGYGQEAEIIFHENYKLSGVNKSKEKDSGKWHIDENKLCMRFYHWGEKQELCYLVYESDDEYLLFNHKGMQMYTFEVTEKGSVNFEEGIKYTSTSQQFGPTTTSNRSSADLPPVEKKYNFTKKTAEDVQFFVRQTAQNCPGCNLAKAKLSGEVLIGANLEGANLTEADLSGAVLRRANLKGANLYKANLRDAVLIGADLTGANLTDADLTDAHTQGAIGYEP